MLSGMFHVLNLTFYASCSHISIYYLAASPKSKASQSTDTAPHAAFALDASTIDVYRNTDGVVLVYDISKPWTFEYVAKTLAEVPTNIPVLILVCIKLQICEAKRE